MAIIKRAVRDLSKGPSADKTSSLKYIFSDEFKKDCAECAIDHVSVRGGVKEAMAHDGIRRKVLISKLSKDLVAYS